jgi:carbon-monoxide dehydrogenase small subunit
VTTIRLEVNGKEIEAEVEPRTHLADFLREHLLLTGTHLGCEHGVCGACTVEIGGEIARSCITYAVTCDGAKVRTIEGFDADPMMTRLRQAFTEEHALQCGYCTPGMMIAARDLVRRKSNLSRDEIRVEMSGNLCRCTGYVGIVNAIARVIDDAPSAAVAAPTHGAWLGPAPGPLAERADRAQMPKAAPSAERKTAIAERPRTAVRKAIQVTVGPVEEVDGETRFSQSFRLDHPRDAVWQLMKDPEVVAACMPGMSLDGPPEGDQVKGRMHVKLGPISASFAGEATIQCLDADYRQIITGRGGDRKSGSRLSGRVDYRLSEDPAPNGDPGTKVDVTVGYVLTGSLAQFGRMGIVRDLASRIAETFAQNIEARLTDPGAEPARTTELGGFSLLLSVLLEKLKARLSRLFGSS